MSRWRGGRSNRRDNSYLLHLKKWQIGGADSSTLNEVECNYEIQYADKRGNARGGSVD